MLVEWSSKKLCLTIQITNFEETEKNWCLHLLFYFPIKNVWYGGLELIFAAWIFKYGDQSMNVPKLSNKWCCISVRWGKSLPFDNVNVNTSKITTITDWRRILISPRSISSMHNWPLGMCAVLLSCHYGGKSSKKKYLMAYVDEENQRLWRLKVSPVSLVMPVEARSFARVSIKVVEKKLV